VIIRSHQRRDRADRFGKLATNVCRKVGEHRDDGRESGQPVVQCLRWPPEVKNTYGERFDHVVRPLVEQPEQERIRMEDLDSVGRSGLLGEVLEVEGDYGIRLLVNGDGEHVSVFGIARHLVDECLEPVDQCFNAEGVAHLLHSPPRPVRVDAELGKATFHLIEDLIGPQRPKQPCLSEP